MLLMDVKFVSLAGFNTIYGFIVMKTYFLGYPAG